MSPNILSLNNDIICVTNKNIIYNSYNGFSDSGIFFTTMISVFKSLLHQVNKSIFHTFLSFDILDLIVFKWPFKYFINYSTC